MRALATSRAAIMEPHMASMSKLQACFAPIWLAT